MLAVLTEQPFDNDEWIYETKFDGYRALAAVTADGKVDLYSRNLISFNDRYKPIVAELEKLSHSALLDGEVVIETSSKVSSFQLLQNYLRTGKGTLKYYVFDILHLNGNSTRELAIVKRKELLEQLLGGAKLKHIIYSKHVEGAGNKLFSQAKKKGWEGIIAKHSTSIYEVNKRSREWLKIKLSNEQEAIIIGITAPSGSRNYFGSLVLGAYKGKKLIYIGNCGTGFTDKVLKELYASFKPYFTDKPPIEEKIITKAAVQWIKPKFVAQIKFTEWTKDLSMRHPVYLGLREDKSPRDVHPEFPS